ncbi:hypothetical protein BO71DRAFT_389267 [Aspergillus ellipticus CBS 707.79]|uniref:Uncharacterized protein n=1 Tax=Aspergillus ellipticus CBS 707.79 TaxID=1448320 RepID=A0A319CY50_9EURO|nr:hypothetical protein BO71DRAFT_389267 [Aspergillus ellipticus CBS 707.79]
MPFKGCVWLFHASLPTIFIISFPLPDIFWASVPFTLSYLLDTRKLNVIMSRNVAGGFHSASRVLVQYTGTPMGEIMTSNVVDGNEWKSSAITACELIENAEPRITQVELQDVNECFYMRGSVAHFSSKDKDDRQKVLTMGLRTNNGTQFGAIHVHVDGTWKLFPNRAGREGGYAANICWANIPGLITDSTEGSKD